jgi:hypothetical protein
MPKAKDVVASTTVLTKQQADAVFGAFNRVVEADDMIAEVACMLFEGGYTAVMLLDTKGNDAKNVPLIGEVNALALKAKYGAEGEKLMAKASTLCTKEENEKKTTMTKGIRKMREQLRRAMQQAEDDASLSDKENAKREIAWLTEFVDTALNDLAERVVNYTKTKRDVSTADVAVKIGALRKELKALKSGAK